MNFAPWHITSVSYSLKESECITSYWMLSLNILFRLIFCINRRFIMSEFGHYLDLNHGSKEHLRCAWTYIGRCLVKQIKNTSITAHSFIVYWKGKIIPCYRSKSYDKKHVMLIYKSKHWRLRFPPPFLFYIYQNLSASWSMVTWHGSFEIREEPWKKVWLGIWGILIPRIFIAFILYYTETTTY